MKRAATLVALALAVPVLLSAVEATSYPSATWSAAASCNYTASNRESTYNIDMVVIHTAQGSYSGTISWFKNCNAGASAHYVVSKTGAITAMVRDEDVAWQAGHWATNTRSIGIEHEGFVSDPNAYTDAMYRSSAALTKWLATRYNIPVDRSHIIGHYQVPGCPNPGGGGGNCHTDPGPYWDWSYYMSLIQGGGDSTPPGAPSLTEDHSGSGWSSHASPNWRWVASDAQSGISVYELDPSWAAPFQSGATSYHPTLGDGRHSLVVRAKNGAGLWSPWSNRVAVAIDTTPPATAIAPSGAAAFGGTTFVGPSTRFSLPASDAGSGVAWTRWSLDGGATQTYGGAFTLSAAEGPHVLRAWSGDAAGNVESAKSFAFTMDRTPPDLDVSSPTSNAVLLSTEPVPVAASAYDALSGVARVAFAVDGVPRASDAAAPYEWTWRSGDEAAGPHYVLATATDRVGNAAEVRVDVETLPTSDAGIAATRARTLAWATAPPSAGVVVEGDAGVRVGDQFVGLRGVLP